MYVSPDEQKPVGDYLKFVSIDYHAMCRPLTSLARDQVRLGLYGFYCQVLDILPYIIVTALYLLVCTALENDN